MSITTHLNVDPLIVETPWQRPPLTANQRLHWRKKAKLTKEIRQWAGVLFRTARFSSTPVKVELIWYVNDKRRRDADNLVSTLKPLCDGLVDAGVVADDTPEFMHKVMPAIVFDKGNPQRLVLRVGADR